MTEEELADERSWRALRAAENRAEDGPQPPDWMTETPDPIEQAMRARLSEEGIGRREALMEDRASRTLSEAEQINRYEASLNDPTQRRTIAEDLLSGRAARERQAQIEAARRGRNYEEPLGDELWDPPTPDNAMPSRMRRNPQTGEWEIDWDDDVPF